MKKKVILGMSGGVDSSVCGIILKEQGYDVKGLFMKNWDDSNDEICSAKEDFDDVRKVADKLGIDYYSVNFEKEYWENVFSYFLDEYKNGRTPNPDVLCNSEIKFKAFLEYALKLDADLIAMGHYARKEEVNGEIYLKRGIDENKDQSYFLSRITKEALAKTIFPIGNMEKSKVREIASKYGLVTANKKDSTGICFIGERNFSEFLDKYLLAKKGDIINIDNGKKVGTHTGLIHYTVGQRKGLGIGGVGTGEPWFVVGKNLKENKLYVVQGENHEGLYSKYLIGIKPHFITKEPNFPLECTAKFRYRQKDIKVTVYKEEKNSKDNLDEKLYGTCQNYDYNLKIVYNEKVKAVTKGQIAVLYKGDYCLGSAIIGDVEPINEKYRKFL